MYSIDYNYSVNVLCSHKINPMKTKPGGGGGADRLSAIFGLTAETLNRSLRDMTAFCEIFEFGLVNATMHNNTYKTNILLFLITI